MRAWLVTVGEPLPSDGYGDRLLRAGMLAEILSRRGHEVVWWTSTIDHVRKRQRMDHDAVVSIAPNYTIRLIHSRLYPRNVCLRRLSSHRATARRFARASGREGRPDVILCSLPTIELCHEAVRYGRRSSVPVVIDVRDLWPDLLVDLAPRPVRGIARLGLWPLFRATQASCAGASAIVGLTQEYVNWGLRHAGRDARPADRAFPMAYRSDAPPRESLHAADRFWDDRGITINSHERIVCFFGAIGRHFDFDCVIQAARHLEAADAPVRFVICGDGEQLSYYRRRSKGCRNVLLPGWVGSAEIWSLMRRSALGLAPYYSTPNFVTNLPNKPIEYLSAGLPIVSSLQGVLARLLAENDCGITYDNGNAEQLAQVLLQLSRQPERLNAMSRNALTLYRQRFVAEQVYSEMAQYLEQLADGYAKPVDMSSRCRSHVDLQHSAA